MKYCLVFLAIAVVGSQARARYPSDSGAYERLRIAYLDEEEPPIGTPSPFCQNPGYVFPDPTDCDSFFVCDNLQKPVHYTCQFGQQFNPESNKCDDPENVSCYQLNSTTATHFPTQPLTTEPPTRTESPTVLPTTTPFVPVCLTPGQVIPDATNCSVYYVCDAGLHYVPLTCPDGLYWNPEGSFCDYPSNVDCRPPTPPPPTTTVAPTTTKKPTTTTPKPTTTTEEPTTTTKEPTTTTEKATTTTEEPTTTTAEPTTTTEEPTTTTTEEPTTTTTEEPTTTTTEEPTTTTEEPTTTTTEEPTTTTTEEPTTTTTEEPTTTTEEPTTTTTEEPTTTTTEEPTTTTTEEPTTTTTEEPTTTTAEPTTTTEEPTTTTTEEPTTTTQEPTTTTQVPTTTTADPYVCTFPSQVLPSSSSCATYYICDVNNEPKRHKCDGDLLYDPAYANCNFPERVECSGLGRRPLPIPTAYPDPAPQPDSRSCDEVGDRMYSLAYCNAYWKCSQDLVMQAFTCPPDLYYKKLSGNCDILEEVNCAAE